MCALEKPKVDDSSRARARDSLQALLNTSSPTTDQVSKAIDALQALRTRLSTTRQERATLLEQARRWQGMKKDAAAHAQRLDTEIIQAKMEAGELLTVRDSVARDLGRAKRALNRLDALEDEEDVDVDVLVKKVGEEMDRMREAEKNLLEVMEEISAVKKRRAELQEKVKVAQEEW